MHPATLRPPPVTATARWLCTRLLPAALASAPAAAQQPESYSLWNPKPREELRPLSADRPDTTESAITVDAGHVQFEVSLGDWTRERRDDVFVALQTNAKLGLTDKLDLQVVFDTYAFEDNVGANGSEGFGDVQLRLKRNLWGNDGGPSAFALFPYVKLPTGTERSNGELEGGLIVPYARSLSPKLDLGLMAELDVVYDEAEDDHDLEVLHTAVLGTSFNDRWGQFTEYVGVLADDQYLPSLNLGLTYGPNPDLLFDVGVRLGLADELPDLGVFLGFTARY